MGQKHSRQSICTLWGKSIFVNPHVRTEKGPIPRDLKKMIASFCNQCNKDINPAHFREFFHSDVGRSIEAKYRLKFGTCFSTGFGDLFIFINQENQTQSIAEVSDMRIFSLTELAAAKVSSELESEADIKVIIEHRLIPAHLEDLLLKYI